MVIETQVKNSHAGGRNSNNDRFSAFTPNAGSHVSNAHNSNVEFHDVTGNAGSHKGRTTEPVVYTDSNAGSGSGSKRSVRTPYIGPLEYKIIDYLLNNNITYFSIAELRYALASIYHVNVDRRNVWWAVQRLVRRGIVVKESRGWYRLDRLKASVLREAYLLNNGVTLSVTSRSPNDRPLDRPNDTDTPQAARATADGVTLSKDNNVQVVMPNGGGAHDKQYNMDWARLNEALSYLRKGDVKGFFGSLFGSLDCDMIRIHARMPGIGGLLSLFALLVMAIVIENLTVKVIEFMLVSYVGVSKSYVKRIASAARKFAFIITEGARFIPVVHGVGRYRANGSDITINWSSKEIGFDILLPWPSVFKFYLKIYSDRSDRAMTERPTITLDRFFSMVKVPLL